MKRREFAKRAASAAAALPLLRSNWAEASRQEAAKQETAPASRAEELKKKAEANREQMVAALRAKPLAFNLEPAFVFAAKARERKKQAGKEGKR